MGSSAWPAFNASLNGASALLLTAGFACIRARKIAAHRACMVAACGVSTVFLVSYLLYHARVGAVRYHGPSGLRPIYLGVLLTHTVLAVLIVPLAIRTLWLAARQRFTAHRAIARWTLPLWLYVSITGVVVYWMLYH